ncbi:hypothetical protein SmJEL517_g03149 [Synchytrium microbalum]|uniref:ABC transporter domain-containing protein n=1 Tax=Synchytrium microbalum TaxID=1806994 RepID=A0A507C4A6_9FUNG|nr:uncharacterized protein SmJEL517_g03149 [Synchytrium microbalum]TPX34218.1 hypothetical protein SmJEL517_g03149 [Synchytrium microbalum]
MKGKTEQISSLITQTAPSLDPELLSYATSYFDDTTSDRSQDALIDFLFPLLSEAGAQEDSVSQLCRKLSELSGYLESQNGTSDKAVKLENTVSMKDVSAKNKENNAMFGGSTSNGGVDLSHHSVNGKLLAKSTVDQGKLRAAEEQRRRKLEKRGEDRLLEFIPVWNPAAPPAIIVNQGKLVTTGGQSQSKDLKIENFDIQYAGKKILQNADLSMVYGRRYGLVGKNGVGKSTLLRAIAHGELQTPPHMRILHVEQEIAGDDTEAIASVLAADVERESLLKEEKELNADLQRKDLPHEDYLVKSARIKEVYQRLEDIDSDRAESRASSILAGLGFTVEQQRAATRTFSGGWRMRLALARALFCRPDLFPAVVWLEQYFQNWNATLLVVSHDRSFLDAVTTDVLHLHSGQMDAYRGNFSQFLSTHTERRKNQLREYESQLAYRAHLQAFIDRWRYNANRAAQAQSKIKILEKLPPLEPPPKDEMEGFATDETTGENIYFRFPEAEKLSPPILQMNEVTFGYDKSRLILKKVSLDLQMDSKIAIVGPNGAGKTTLVRLITGEIEASSGFTQRHGRLRLALFSQHHVDQLELAGSSVSFLSSRFPGRTEEEYRRVLARYGLTGTTALQPIGTLSGGQKSRVVFAHMALQNPHVLIMDEPTNHLDMSSIDALAAALRRFNGGIIIVSHDQRFLDAVCSEIWICDKGSMTRFEGRTGDQSGIVEQYKRSLIVD